MTPTPDTMDQAVMAFPETRATFITHTDMSARGYSIRYDKRTNTYQDRIGDVLDKAKVDDHTLLQMVRDRLKEAENHKPRWKFVDHLKAYYQGVGSSTARNIADVFIAVAAIEYVQGKTRVAPKTQPETHQQSLLDHFAGLAMQGIMGNSDYADSFQPSQSMAHEGIASHAYKLASAMIAERNRLMNP